MQRTHRVLSPLSLSSSSLLLILELYDCGDACDMDDSVYCDVSVGLLSRRLMLKWSNNNLFYAFCGV